MTPATAAFEIEFRWKEQVIYWEGPRGCVFPGAWGVDPPITIVPDLETWDRAVPDWLIGRHHEVVARLRVKAGHIVMEERDDSAVINRHREVFRSARTPLTSRLRRIMRPRRGS